jgi:hypothetical protein
MEDNSIIQSNASRWFIGGGFFAALVFAFILWVDHKLSTSDGEKVLGQTLHELRSAQSSLAGLPVDPRVDHGLNGSAKPDVDAAAPAAPEGAAAGHADHH